MSYRIGHVVIGPSNTPVTILQGQHRLVTYLCGVVCYPSVVVPPCKFYMALEAYAHGMSI